MRKLTRFILSLVTFATAATLLPGCEEVTEYENTWEGNYDALVEIIDRHYCFLDEKGLDWQATADRYRSKLKPKMSQLDFFYLCSSLLDELKDGHVNLVAPFSTSYYRRWWSDYPQDFDLRTLQMDYLGGNYLSTNGVIYQRMPDQVGYIYIPSFSVSISELTLDYALNYFDDCKALIIDIRNNGGGLLTNVETIVGRFITQPTCGGWITHKTGPGHNDFSKPFEVVYKPTDPQKHICWTDRPIYLLTNRSAYSAANDFTAVMKSLPQVTVVGAKTGGGGGLPFSSELPNGWGVRFSASPLTAPDGSSAEQGIDPSPGWECHSPEEELTKGIDHILDVALEAANSRPAVDNK